MTNLPLSNTYWNELQKELEGTTTKGGAQQNIIWEGAQDLMKSPHIITSPTVSPVQHLPSILTLITDHDPLSFGIVPYYQTIEFLSLPMPVESSYSITLESLTE